MTPGGEVGFSQDTEILTDSGWCCVVDMRAGHRVLSRSPSGLAEWQSVETVHSRTYHGPAIHLDGKSIDLLVAPDHKLLVRRRIVERGNSIGRCTPWHMVRASDIFAKHNYEMLRAVHWNPPDIGDFTHLSGTAFHTNALLAFLGLYLGDGSSDVNKRGYRIRLAAFKGRELDIGAEVLQRLGLRYSRTTTGYQFFSKALFKMLNPLGHAYDKFIPTWVKNLPPARLEHLLYGLMNSDGSTQTETYTTVSPTLADDVQEVMLKAGYVAIVRCAGQQPEHELKGHTVRSNYPIYKIRLCRKQFDPKIRPATHKHVDYRGMLCCVTLPGHSVYVRRHGKSVWSGDTS